MMNTSIDWTVLLFDVGFGKVVIYSLDCTALDSVQHIRETKSTERGAVYRVTRKKKDSDLLKTTTTIVQYLFQSSLFKAAAKAQLGQSES